MINDVIILTINFNDDLLKSKLLINLMFNMSYLGK